MIAPYGEWASPVTVSMAAAASGGLTWPCGVGGRTWWCASDPQTATVALMSRDADGTVASVLGPGWSVRNRVIGYGGRPYAVRADGLLVFTEDSDRRLYRGDGSADSADAARPGRSHDLLRRPKLPSGRLRGVVHPRDHPYRQRGSGTAHIALDRRRAP